MGGIDGMGGMGGMRGMRGMDGMPGGSSDHMGGMGGYGDMAYGRDGLFEGDNERPYDMDAMGGGEAGPMTQMADEDAVERNHVPGRYDKGLEEMPFSRYYREPEMLDEEDPGEEENDEDEGDFDLLPGRARAAFDEPYEDYGPESDMDDGYEGGYERKTKIAKVETPTSGKTHKTHKKNTETPRRDKMKGLTKEKAI